MEKKLVMLIQCLRFQLVFHSFSTSNERDPFLVVFWPQRTNYFGQIRYCCYNVQIFMILGIFFKFLKTCKVSVFNYKG